MTISLFTDGVAPRLKISSNSVMIFAATEVIKLEQNYRSTGCILDAANAVIANNPARLGKNLWTDDEEGEPIALYAGFNEQDEARFIVERIEHHVSEGSHFFLSSLYYTVPMHSQGF